jgi:hypothetical protein
MNKREKLAFVLVGTLALTTSGLAYAVSSVPLTQDIYGCVATSSGAVTNLSSKKPQCPKGTSLLTLNVQGPKGDQGFQGSKGDRGEKGLQGDPGFSYDEALASVTDDKSEVRTLFSGETMTGNRFGDCVGGTAWNRYESGQTFSGCALELRGVSRINILGVKAGNEYLAQAQMLYLFPGECPSNYIFTTQSFNGQEAGFLISGSLPYNISLSSETVCMTTKYFPQSSQNTAFQIVFSTN